MPPPASVAPRLRSDMTIGVGWGVTLKAFAEAMPNMPLEHAAVVAMLGSLTRRSSIDEFEAATILAARLGAECFYMPGPLVCDSEESRDTLINQPMMQEVFSRAHMADIAILSVGGLDSGTIRRVHFVDDDDFAAVREAGAIGNFLGHYIDDEARVIDHAVNRRVIGVNPEALARIPERIMVSGGAAKHLALKAILSAGLVTGLVTDLVTARWLLED